MENNDAKSAAAERAGELPDFPRESRHCSVCGNCRTAPCEREDCGLRPRAPMLPVATPASPASATELNAMRWLFTMKHQDMQVHPQAFLDMFRKVREDGRAAPTRAEYEAATDAAMIETGFVPASAQPVSIAGLGSMTNEDDGVLTLRFKDEDSALDFMHSISPTVDCRDMPDVPAPEPVSQPVVAVPAKEVVETVACTCTQGQCCPVCDPDAYATPLAAPVEQDKQEGEQPNVAKMVNRFLAWPLPSSVLPDGCVMNRAYPHRIGTHLLTADEAKAMFLHCLGERAK